MSRSRALRCNFHHEQTQSPSSTYEYGFWKQCPVREHFDVISITSRLKAKTGPRPCRSSAGRNVNFWMKNTYHCGKSKLHSFILLLGDHA
ncbi:hypothetical protein Y032_0390g559 [Ancylostoma ceylanicum]|uniref:Uncharacterized protein n=1 Tax=Ancylostoma ceylanicum TaxID=53326 RepID=A0A016RSC2_9BILA|nr:hypothetical protein Y032_0390g559 [Ancylostoma ceylanicum]